MDLIYDALNPDGEVIGAAAGAFIGSVLMESAMMVGLSSGLGFLVGFSIVHLSRR